MFGTVKRLFAVFLTASVLASMPVGIRGAEEKLPFDVNAKAAVLMDAETGTVTFREAEG